MNKNLIALWVLGGLMLVIGVVFNSAGDSSLDPASLVQGRLGPNLMVGGLLMWGLALHARAGR